MRTLDPLFLVLLLLPQKKLRTRSHYTLISVPWISFYMGNGLQNPYLLVLIAILFCFIWKTNAPLAFVLMLPFYPSILQLFIFTGIWFLVLGIRDSIEQSATYLMVSKKHFLYLFLSVLYYSLYPVSFL